VTFRVEVLTDADAAAARVGELVAERAADRQGLTLALSKAPAPLLDRLAHVEGIEVFQVDERVAPPGDPARNVLALLARLPHDRLRPMPVEDAELDGAALRYEGELPPALDLVHLGLGPDGHTASLVPGDPVLDVDDRLVALTGEYQGYRRMTLTYPALAAARELVWLVTGAEKREALSRLLAGDTTIPAGRVTNDNQLVVVDAAAAGGQAEA
jgi:6-phosphogluconolactonase/glucosamine-6-phosphate isomerase/deaminase